MARKAYDWEAIEADFRSGQFSYRQLSKLHGASVSAIQKRSKKLNWERDLSDKVRKQTETELARDAVQDPQYKTDEREIVKAAGLRAADVVRAHRQGIARLHALGARISAQLDRSLMELEKEKAPAADTKDLQRMLNGFGHACRAESQLIILERQAFGLDPRGAETDDDKKEAGPVKFVMNFGGKK